MKVSLIIPVYNEADHLERFLKKIDSLELPMEKELVIIDDCSKDSSLSIIQNFPFRSQVQILLQEFNQGKGAALQRGILAATGDVVGIQDADFEYDTEDVPQLLTPFLTDRADVVYGSRFKKSASQVHRTFHYLINHFPHHHEQRPLGALPHRHGNLLQILQARNHSKHRTREQTLWFRTRNHRQNCAPQSARDGISNFLFPTQLSRGKKDHLERRRGGVVAHCELQSTA